MGDDGDHRLLAIKDMLNNQAPFQHNDDMKMLAERFQGLASAQ